ncbi:MAG: SPOR domain-containing protein [Gammaproteobacteria bacterium]|jgi:hypothetical protein
MHGSAGPSDYKYYLKLVAAQAILILFVMYSDDAISEIYSDKLYAINIMSQHNEISNLEKGNITVQQGYILYTTVTTIKNVTWHRLRLGFFGSQKEARKYINTYLRDRSDLWIAAISADEYLNNKSFNDEQLFIKAQTALNNRNYDESEAIFKKIIAANDKRHKASALVSLGDIYEKTGDLASAVDVYKQYISLYPHALNINRITDRKNELEQQLHATRPWVSSGELSQSLSRHTNYVDNIDPLQPPIYTERNSINTYLNYTGYKNYANSSLRVKFNGDFDYSLINQQSHQSLSASYLSLAYSASSQTAELGRQPCYGCAINGLLDGLSYSYAPIAPVELKLSVGNPVDYSSNPYQNERFLYSLNIDARKLFGNTNLRTYFAKQTIEGIDDREAIGMAFNYSGKQLSLSSNLDYDLFYDTFNYLFVSARYRTTDNISYNVAYNRQRNPFLSLRNALYGQAETTVHELLAFVSLDELKTLSEQRTSSIRTLTLNTVRPISDNLQTSLDVSVLHRSDMPLPYDITGNVPGYGLVLGAQLIGKSLVKNGDLTIASAEYMKDDKNESSLLRLSSRYPATQLMEIHLAIALRHTDFYGETPKWKLFPTLAVSYQAKNNWLLEAAGGIEYADPDITQIPSSKSGSFYEFRYRLRY